VDIFYSHRFDPDTPLAETMMALDQTVRSGKALYVGISSYSARRTAEAAQIARELGTPLLIHQPSYSMFNRWIEQDDEGHGSVLDRCEQEGIGIIAFSALAQGLLTDRYLEGIPEGSRGARGGTFNVDALTGEVLARVRALNQIAGERGQSLAQMALAWVLRDERVTSTLVGASSVEQLRGNLAALSNLSFSDEEIARIDEFAVEAGVNRWAKSSAH